MSSYSQYINVNDYSQWEKEMFDMAKDGSPQGGGGHLRLIVTAVIAVAAFIVWELIAKYLLDAIPNAEFSTMERFFFIKGLFCVFLAGLIAVTRTHRSIGLNRIGGLWTVLLATPMFLLGMLIAVSPEATWPFTPALAIGWIALTSFGVFSEEVLFRGYVQSSFGGRYLWSGAIISSLGFGGVHLLGLTSSVQPDVIMAQAVFAASLGLIFAAVRLASRGLWLPIILHAGFNTIAFLPNGPPQETLESGDEPAMGILMAAGAMAIVALPILYFAIGRARKHLNA